MKTTWLPNKHGYTGHYPTAENSPRFYVCGLDPVHMDVVDTFEGWNNEPFRSRTAAAEFLRDELRFLPEFKDWLDYSVRRMPHVGLHKLGRQMRRRDQAREQDDAARLSRAVHALESERQARLNALPTLPRWKR